MHGALSSTGRQGFDRRLDCDRYHHVGSNKALQPKGWSLGGPGDDEKIGDDGQMVFFLAI